MTLPKRVKITSSEGIQRISEDKSSPKRVMITSLEEMERISDLISEDESSPKRTKLISSEELEDSLSEELEKFLYHSSEELEQSLDFSSEELDMSLEDESLPKSTKPISSEGMEWVLNHPLEENKLISGHPVKGEGNKWTLDATTSHESNVPSAISPIDLSQLLMFHKMNLFSESFSENSVQSDSSKTLDVLALGNAHNNGGEKGKRTTKENPESQKQNDMIYLNAFANKPLDHVEFPEEYGDCFKEKLMKISGIIACDMQYQNRNAAIWQEHISSQMRRDILEKENGTSARTRYNSPTSESNPFPKALDLSQQNNCFFPDIQYFDPSPEIQLIDWLQVRKELRLSGVNEAVQGIRLSILQSKAEDRLRLRRLALYWNIDINLF